MLERNRSSSTISRSSKRVSCDSNGIEISAEFDVEPISSMKPKRWSFLDMCRGVPSAEWGRRKKKIGPHSRRVVVGRRLWFSPAARLSVTFVLTFRPAGRSTTSSPICGGANPPLYVGVSASLQRPTFQFVSSGQRDSSRAERK